MKNNNTWHLTYKKKLHQQLCIILLNAFLLVMLFKSLISFHYLYFSFFADVRSLPDLGFKDYKLSDSHMATHFYFSFSKACFNENKMNWVFKCFFLFFSKRGFILFNFNFHDACWITVWLCNKFPWKRKVLCVWIFLHSIWWQWRNWIVNKVTQISCNFKWWKKKMNEGNRNINDFESLKHFCLNSFNLSFPSPSLSLFFNVSRLLKIKLFLWPFLTFCSYFQSINEWKGQVVLYCIGEQQKKLRLLNR